MSAWYLRTKWSPDGHFWFNLSSWTPQWAAASVGAVSLRLCAGDESVLVECWNQNNVTPPDRVGGARVDVAAITTDAQRLRLPLDTGGEVVVSARRGKQSLQGNAVRVEHRSARAADWHDEMPEAA